MLVYTQHERTFEANRFVYPVISRRAGGMSIGVNLNPDKVCNFDCIYCQVDRVVQAETRFVELPRLLEELEQLLGDAVSGALFRHHKFADVPLERRRLNDIAFSGDGEPTSHRNFDSVVAACAEVKRRHALQHVKLVVITNASLFHRPHVQRGLEVLDRNEGEIWAKLDAGTEAYFRQVDRSPFALQRILDNITRAAQLRPLVIQSLFMRIDGQPPPPTELAAYCDRLCEIGAAGGQLQLVQVYTVARRPAQPNVQPLRDGELEAIAELVRNRTRLPVAAYYGV